MLEGLKKYLKATKKINMTVKHEDFEKIFNWWNVVKVDKNTLEEIEKAKIIGKDGIATIFTLESDFSNPGGHEYIVNDKGIVVDTFTPIQISGVFNRSTTRKQFDFASGEARETLLNTSHRSGNGKDISFKILDINKRCGKDSEFARDVYKAMALVSYHKDTIKKIFKAPEV